MARTAAFDGIGIPWKTRRAIVGPDNYVVRWISFVDSFRSRTLRGRVGKQWCLTLNRGLTYVWERLETTYRIPKAAGG